MYSVTDNTISRIGFPHSDILGSKLVASSPGLLGCHPLKGERKGEYSVEVNGNWRVVFKVEEPNVLDVDLEDYH